MWRRVTRGLVPVLAALLAPALFAQTFVGDVDSPDPARVHSGVVVVKGWVLDPDQVTKIELWVDDQYQHNAILNLPRVDVISAYPAWPGIQNARPGFITGFLASRFTDGAHTVEVRVYNSKGDVNFLGRRTITINNSINQAPFGFVDIPDPGGVYNVSGAFPVSGWAADTDSIERIEILVDETVLQSAMYGDPRPDVGVTFADFPGAMHSGFVANVDSTRMLNGVHALSVRAWDRKGWSSVIGRRTVQIINNDVFLKPFGFLDEPQRDATLFGTTCGPGDADDEPILSPPIRFESGEHLTPVRGWALDLGTRTDSGRVAYVELMIDGVPWISTDDCGVVGSQFTNCYGVRRPDVARYYPTFPDAPLAGFFFTLDVGALLNLGVRPGGHRMSVVVGDRDQTFAELPNHDGIPVWFQCVDDEFDFAAFGFIDFPHNYDYISGTVNFYGWALEDQEDIEAIEMWIDGNRVGFAQHGYPRSDVADAYPQIDGSEFSGWLFSYDTRKLAASIHRLNVVVIPSTGQPTSIGSVDFYVTNNNPQP